MKARLPASVGLLLLVISAPIPAWPQSLAPIEQAYLDGRYEDVVELADAYVATTRDPAPIAWFLRGAARYERGEWQQAQGDLRNYLEREQDFAEEADSLLALMASDGAWTTTWLLQLGLIRDSRVIVRDPDSTTGLRELDDMAVRGRLVADVEHHNRFSLSYRAYWLTYDEAEDADRLEQSLDVMVTRPIGRGDLETGLVLESRLRDYEEDFWRIGARSEYAWVTRTNRIAWVGLEGGYDQFPRFDAADGAYLLGSVGYEQYLGRLSLFWDSYLHWHDADRDDQSLIEAGGGVVGSYQVLPRFGLGLTLRGAAVSFDAPDPFDGIEREDTFFSSRAWIRLQLRHNLDLIPSIEYVNNSSNADYADYDENVIGIDLMWLHW